MFPTNASMSATLPKALFAANDAFRSTNVLPYSRPVRHATKTAQSAGGRGMSAAERDDIRRRNHLIALANAQARMENDRREQLLEEYRSDRHA